MQAVKRSRTTLNASSISIFTFYSALSGAGASAVLTLLFAYYWHKVGSAHNFHITLVLGLFVIPFFTLVGAGLGAVAGSVYLAKKETKPVHAATLRVMMTLICFALIVLFGVGPFLLYTSALNRQRAAELSQIRDTKSWKSYSFDAKDNAELRSFTIQLPSNKSTTAIVRSNGLALRISTTDRSNRGPKPDLQVFGRVTLFKESNEPVDWVAFAKDTLQLKDTCNTHVQTPPKIGDYTAVSLGFTCPFATPYETLPTKDQPVTYPPQVVWYVLTPQGIIQFQFIDTPIPTDEQDILPGILSTVKAAD